MGEWKARMYEGKLNLKNYKSWWTQRFVLFYIAFLFKEERQEFYNVELNREGEIIVLKKKN